tara:strand:+ start:4979 stop:5404 length:426 start_codon:yes stop_codon:yes gene_type:complete
MRKTVLISLLLSIFTLPAAQAIEDVMPVSVSKAECRRIIRHVAADDVKYKPGVDVRGNKVVGASTKGDDGFRFKAPDVIEFDLSISPLGAGVAGGRLSETTASVGKVKYDINKRRITVNGQPLGDKEASELAERCKAAGFR